jgi:glycosyltransferase involved in cell wall biosynthesis
MFFINLFRVFWNYDVVHMWTYFYLNSIFTLIYKLFARKTKLIMACDTFPGYSFNPGFLTKIIFKIYALILGWFLFSVPNKIHLYGESMAKFALKAGVKQKKIDVVPTGVNIEKFSKAKDIDRKELGLGKNDFVIMYAGLIVPRKGIDVMLKVTKRLVRKQKNTKLLLVGEGPSKNKYEKMAESMGISKNVVFAGWRKDIPQVMKTANVLILPSRGEGLPGIVMEAMASGLPVVASNIPCIPDLIEEGVSGFLCTMNDVNCFAKKVMESKKHSDSVKKNAFNKIKNFRWEKLLDKYKKMYSK